MGQAKTAEDLQREAAEKEEVFTAKKKARLEKPNAAADKGSLCDLLHCPSCLLLENHPLAWWGQGQRLWRGGAKDKEWNLCHMADSTIPINYPWIDIAGFCLCHMKGAYKLVFSF
jgi:hypothetical protein